MIDPNYSKAAFEAVGLDTPESADKASALEQEILVELLTVAEVVN